MQLSEILSVDRVSISGQMREITTKEEVLQELARLLCSGGDCSEAQILQQLKDREALQSTGIGEGVAIPHTAVSWAQGQRAALVLCPAGVSFDSIDGEPARIFLGVIGPKSEASAHLKILAKVSRLLRSPDTRRRLLESSVKEQAYSLIRENEAPPTQ